MKRDFSQGLCGDSEQTVSGDDDELDGLLRTSSSFRLLHSSQPPSHRFFILLRATKRFPAHSGLAPAPHCIGDSGVFGGRGECQSTSHTVPNEPSPTTLIKEYDRSEADDG